MRPEDLKELLLNGISFISERLLHHGTADANTAPTTPSPDNGRSATIRVDRIKSPASCFSSSPDHILSPSPFSQDYELTWRDNGRNYISNAGFESIASLLRAWKDDLEIGNVSRCPYPDPIVRRFDDMNDSSSGGRKETRLSAVVHNFMLDRSGENSEKAWQDAVVELARVIEATEQWIADFYAPENFDLIKAQGTVPYEGLSTPIQKLYDGCCGLCAIGDFLAFAILETHQWGHPGMRSSQLALMQLLVDLEAFHKQQPILSFVVVEKQTRPPGYLFDDEGAVESVTADELRCLWLYGTDKPPILPTKASTTRLTSTPKPLCRVYGDSALNQRSQHANRQSRIASAAAASLKSARRAADGRGPIQIAPTHSLLFEKYRRTSDAAGLFQRYSLGPSSPAIRDYQLPAKRKAKTPAVQDLRQFKRSRLEKAKRSSENAEAQAAALVPLPPSPAATETSDEDNDLETAVASASAATTAVETIPQPQQRRLPWASIFPSDDDEDAEAGPRLRISAAKAEELRLIAEQKRATEEAARLKREAEVRRKAEERRRKEEEERAKSSGLRAPSRKVISSLSDSWHARVISAMRCDPNKDVAKSPEGTPLRSKDFLTVVPKSEWLNDEIVNGFLLHLANHINGKAGITNPKTQTPKCHAFTSFFWKPLSTKGAAGTERWMKRVGVRPDNFLSIDTILIPICEHSHWTLVVVRPTRGVVAHMDSLGNRGSGRREVTDTVMRWVRDLLKDKYVASAWRVQHYNSPRQTNGWDCGVHTVTNAMFMSLGLDPSFYGSKEMPLQRDRIAAMLINGGFSGDFDLSGV